MKRTPLKRKSPLRSRNPAQSRRKQPKKGAGGDLRWRSPDYLSFIRALPCASCGCLGGDAHHLVGMWGLSGMGLTAPDDYAMPLCRICHGEVHMRSELQRRQPEWLRVTLITALQELGDQDLIERLLSTLRDVESRQ